MKTRDELSAREIEALHERLLRRLGDTSVPTLPMVAMRIVELISDKSAGVREFARVIETDQALAGRLLRMANSSFFGQRSQVTSLDRACLLLGMHRLKALALGFHLTQAASSGEGAAARKRAWTRSLFAACLACRLAELFDTRISGEAFVIALMCDGGAPLMPAMIGDRYAEIIDESADPQAQYQAEYTTLGFTHVDVVSAMCRMWNLPGILHRAIVSHHTRPQPFEEYDADAMLHAIAYFAGSIPSQPGETPEVTRDATEFARRQFGLDNAAMRAIVEQAGKDLKSYKDFFRHILDETTSIDSIVAALNAHLADAIDELAEEPPTNGEEAGMATRRFMMPNFVLEASRTHENTIRVYIDDSQGQRLVTEEFTPSSRSDQEIASILMLDDLSPSEARRVITTIRNLAA